MSHETEENEDKSKRDIMQNAGRKYHSLISLLGKQATITAGHETPNQGIILSHVSTSPPCRVKIESQSRLVPKLKEA